MTGERSAITRWLERRSEATLVVYAGLASFLTYFAMYAFRKPFAAGTYSDLAFFGTTIDLKTAFVIAQIMGYTLSKFIGIKVVSEQIGSNRMLWLLGLIGVAEASLILFAVLPVQLKIVALFLNGIPLGMVWGMVISYLEGRRTTELLLAILSCSFIVSSGIVKDVGLALLGAGVGEWWMPVLTGALFLPVFAFATYLLNQVPPPTEADIDARAERKPMMTEDRRRFFARFFTVMLPLLFVYFFLTAYRDFRDNYGVDLFNELGYKGAKAIFTSTEVPVAIGVLVALATINLIKDNRRGVMGAYGLMTLGCAMLLGGTALLDAEMISGRAWMIMTGLGSYLAYVPFGSVLFERIIAFTRVSGTAVFAIYVADSIGYLGSISIQLYKDLAQSGVTRLGFFRNYTYFMGVFGAVLLVVSLVIILRQGAGPVDTAER